MGQLHVFFFPMLAHGHMIPALDLARLFASHGAKTTIITTTLNVSVFDKTIQRIKLHQGIEIGLHAIKFPATEVGLPPDCESVDKVTMSTEMTPKFLKAVSMLQKPFERVLREIHPDCLIADMFYPWATEAAAKIGIPRLVFHGTSFFPLCAMECIRLYKPHSKVSSHSEQFVLPNLPHEIKLTKMQLDHYSRHGVQNDITKLIDQMKESELTSYGVVVNSFYELEPDYADHYRNILGTKAWHVGPLSLCSKEVEDKAQRGKKSSIDEHECLYWLNSKEPNSVVYVCFGSIANFTASQLHELAMGLEECEQQFIWVVRKSGKDEASKEDWLPEGFEERTKARGLIIRGWAPQVLILDHEAVGAFVTHCGWNSTLEGVSAGKPLVTWPVFAEQFYNEKLITDILRIGIAVGSKEWNRVASEGVKREAISKAVKQIMLGEEAEEIRNRAKALKEMARKAFEEVGSSYCDLDSLIEELSSQRS